jgi:hypothetical protein
MQVVITPPYMQSTNHAITPLVKLPRPDLTHCPPPPHAFATPPKTHNEIGKIKSQHKGHI